jgi:hypothetical protein
MNKDYNALGSVGVGVSGKVASSVLGTGLGSNKTVFSELKLSEILLKDIDVYKEQIKSKDKLLERNENQVIMLRKNLKESSRIIEKLKL